MPIEIEENFPRGGKKPALSQKSLPNNNKNLFSTFEKSKANKKSKKNKKNEVSKSDLGQEGNISAVAAETLTYNKLQEGMLILGCVNHITALTVHVELPGHIYGSVHINSISNEFTNFIEKLVTDDTMNDESDLVKLDALFRIGQFIPTKVLSVGRSEEKMKVMLSLKPSVINADLSYKNIRKRQLIWAAVSSILDHGYQLNNGVNNCRIFLPFDKVDKDNFQQLTLGQPLWCVTEKSNISSTASTITVSMLKEDVLSAIEKEEISLHYCIPGMQFPLTVTQHVKFGVEVSFNEQCTGYINESYFKGALDVSSKYREGEVLLGRILYIQPTVKLTYFTLRGLEDALAPKLKIGAIIEGKVFSYASKGILMELGKNDKGFIAFRRILPSLSKNFDDNIIQNIKLKYQIGSSYQCRILEYHHLDNVYFCTVEKDLIEEKYFTPTDVKVGETINVTAVDIKESGIVVQFGQLKGFIKNLHLSGAQYSNNIKKKFFVGQKLNAKVWNIDENGNIELTLKQSLIESEKCLRSYEEAKIGEVYPGIVVQTSKAGVLFIFYCNTRGFLPQRFMTDLGSGEAFYVGQVVNVTVIDVVDNKLTLGLDTSKVEINTGITVGHFTHGIITKKEKGSLEILTNKNIRGIIPAAHLCLNYTLAEAFLEKYNEGDALKNLLCISNKDKPIFSVRESQVLKQLKKSLPKFRDLSIGDLLRCSYVSRDQKGIKVICPFKKTCKRFIIKNKDLIDDSSLLEKVQFYDHQVIIAKVTEINKDKKHYRLTARLSEVFDYNLQYTIERFQNYLNELEELKTNLKANSDSITNLKIGQKVQVTVSEINESSSKVYLSNGVQGTVDMEQYPENIKEAEVYNGIIIWIDYLNKVVKVSLKKKFLKMISSKKGHNSLIDKSIFAEYILITAEYAVAVVKEDESKGQIILSPTCLHENDFVPNLVSFEKEVKVLVLREYGSYYLGFPEDYNNMTINQIQNNSKESATINSKCKDFSNGNKLIKEDELRLDFQKASKKRKIKSAHELNGELSSKNFNNEIAQTTVKKKKVKQSIQNKSNRFSEEEQQENEEIMLDSDISLVEDNIKELNKDLSYNGEWQNNKQEDEEVNSSSKSENYVKVKKKKSKHKDENKESVAALKKKRKTDVSTLDTDQPRKKHKNENSAEISKNSEEIQKQELKETETKHLLLPGVIDFFEESKPLKDKDDSDDEFNKSEVENKKKRLTAAERKELARQREEEIRKKELELLEDSENPQSSEQFDRLLIANPNSSRLWIQYMAFHMGNTQTDLARAVAKKALATIDMRELQEKLNVWLALLNLEHRFGDKESLEKAFEEAIRSNDSFQIYIETIKMFADSQSFVEMEEKIRKVKGKFKQEPKMWLEIAKVYYKCGRLKDARNLKQGALRSINNKKEHIDLITQFAIMEFNYGESEQGEALFETIIQSVPQRVDVWCTYVDQLVKKNKIDLARRVLDRSICQKLSTKRVATLFKKYKNFEEKYGTKENLDRLKKLATEYTPFE